MRFGNRLSTLKRRVKRNASSYRNATYLLVLVMLFGVANHSDGNAPQHEDFDITPATTTAVTTTVNTTQRLSLTTSSATTITTTTTTTTTTTSTTTHTTPISLSTTSVTAAVSHETENSTNLAIPNISCQFKAYMSWKVFSSRSAQYKLQQSCWTDDQGIRRFNNDVVIALGTYYTSGVGERFLITLENGHSFTAIIGDVKADCHTDSTNRYNVRPDGSGSLIEFIVDTPSLDVGVRRSGNIGTYAEYAGEIKSIVKLT